MDLNKLGADCCDFFKRGVDELGKATHQGLKNIGIYSDKAWFRRTEQTLVFFSGKEFYIHADIKKVGLAALAILAGVLSSAPASIIMFGMGAYFLYEGVSKHTATTHIAALGKEIFLAKLIPWF